MNHILNLNNKPLKYIITKNKNTINFLKETGSLIVYEPNPTPITEEEYYRNTYREIWVGSYFLASGFGAESREEQSKLSYIYQHYDTDYSYLDNRIINSFSYSYNLWNDLNQRKVTRGTEEYNDISYDDINISYNTFKFGDSIIQLKDLYDKFRQIKSLNKFEITDVQYSAQLRIGNRPIEDSFTHLAKVPVGATIDFIHIKITGNTNDSGGLRDLVISLNNQYPQKLTYELTLHDLSQGTVPALSNTKFELSFSKTFSEGDLYRYQIHLGPNEILNDINITVNPTPEGSTLIRPLEAETINNLVQQFPFILYGESSIFIYNGFGNNDNNSSVYYLEINEYRSVLLSDNQYKLDINNDQYISILIDSDVRLISAEYIDKENNQLYNITNFILTRYNSIVSNVEYTQYVLNAKYNPNDNYQKSINPPFLHQSNSELYFDNGTIIFTFTESSSKNDVRKINNANEYWITYTGNIENIPL